MTDRRALAAMLIALAATGCDGGGPGVERSVHPIIECNSETIGEPCDTDDTVCTIERCQQVGADVVCMPMGMAPPTASCESDGDPCTLDSCNMGACEHEPLPVGATCNDGLFCTTGETCNAAGECVDGADACDDGMACTADTCDEDANTCANTPIPAGSPCNDGDPCTENTTCNAGGSCTGGDVVVCDDGNACTDDACTAGLGCAFDPLPASEACDDGVFCTAGDHCDGAGGCVGAPRCDDGNDCTDDVCDELAMTCENVVTPDTACNDQNDCTEDDTCSPGGGCAGTPLSDGTPCTEQGGCEQGTCSAGACTGTTTVPDDTPCDDGDACTTGETCTTGICRGLGAVCDDSDPCTANTCSPDDGCVFFPIPMCAGAPDAGPTTPDAGVADPDAGPGPDATPPGFHGELGGGGCTCRTTTTNPWWPLALAVLFLAVRRANPPSAGGRGRVGGEELAIFLLASLASPAPSHADGFDSELYKPSTTSTSYFTVDRADVLRPSTVNLGVAFSLSSDVLILRDPDTGEILDDGRVVSSRLGMHLVAGVGLLGFLELGAELPLAVSQSGTVDLLRPGESLSGTALGDLRLTAKARALRAGPLRLGVAASLSLPTGDSEAFVGGETYAFAPRAVASLDLGRATFAVNAGYRLRGDGAELGMLAIGDELFGGVAASVAVMPERMWLLAELYAARAADGSGADIEQPAELLAGARYYVAGPWVVQAGAGFGLGHGYGTPGFRGLLTVSYAPRPPASVEVVAPPPIVAKKDPEPEPEPPGDTDGDGYTDDVDGCPEQPEDFDQFQDEDGCPDPDNDGDKILDVDDACPSEPETLNGIDDEDGCPDQGEFEVVENRIVLEERVLFDTNRSRVKSSGKKILRQIVELYKKHPEWDKFIIEGHADYRGPDDYNQKLSLARAQRVRAELIKAGMPPDKIEAVGYGSSRPMAEGTSEAALQKNRRVEFVIIEHTEQPVAPARETPAPGVTP